MQPARARAPLPPPRPRAPQALLAFYFFLAGLLVRGHPFLWILPVAFSAFALAHGAAHYAGRALHAPYALYDAPRAAAWRAAAVHLGYSACAGAGAAALIALDPGALRLEVGCEARAGEAPVEALHTS